MCDVCCEKFNLSTRKQVSCQYCQFKFCRECCSQYLLSTPDEPACMSCKKPWGREFLGESFTQVWMNTVYRGKRESLLFERERSLMPATQHLVEKEKKIRSLIRENLENDKQHSQNVVEMTKNDNRIGYGGVTQTEEEVMRRYNYCQVLAEMNAVLQVRNSYNNGRINYIRNNDTKSERRIQSRVQAVPL